VIIILLGPPGVGKGTQSRLLSEKKQWPLLVMGEILRDAVKRNDDLGKKANSFMQSGNLVPDNIVIEVIDSFLKPSQSYIMDGFPRTITQAEALEIIASRKNNTISHTIYLDADEDELVNRLSARRTCETCKMVYNLVAQPPKKESVCDSCGGKLIQRDDDKPQTVKNRLQVYKANTAPLIEYYKKKSTLRSVNGIGEINAIQNSILEAVR
jgi:adenylate kinase